MIKKCLTLLLLMSFVVLPVSALNMRVGETQTLSIGEISYLQGCQWTISRPNDVVFVTSPQTYSTTVTIKAVNSFPASAPCVVQCKYYFLDLDPTTGRYTYLRSGFKDWTIFVDDSGSGSGGGQTGGDISLNTYNIFTKVDEWHELIAYTNDNNLSWNMEKGPYGFVAVWMPTDYPNKIDIRGVKPGETYMNVSSSSGGYARCKITVLNQRDFKEDEIFLYTTTPEDFEIQCKVIDLSGKKCQIGTGTKCCWSYNSNHRGTVTIPDDIYGLKVVKIEDNAFRDYVILTNFSVPMYVESIGKDAFRSNANLENITIPENCKLIGESAFLGCGLTQLWLPEGVKTLGNNSFKSNSKLEILSMPNSLENIGNGAFSSCNNIIKIISNIKNPFDIPSDAFPDIVYQNATLFVPKGVIDKYKRAEGWCNFKNIYEMENSSNGNEPQQPTSINISSKLTIYRSFSKDIDVTFSPKEAITTINWSSSNNSIATVSSGKVTGKSVGTTIITATTSNNLSATCEVTVVELPDGVKPSEVQDDINNITNLLNRTINIVPIK